MLLFTSNHIDLNAEVTLEPTIQFQQPLSTHWAAPRAVLLTGASGFVGAYLLDELLRQTTADIYCLIRADSLAAGRERLTQHLIFYALWNEQFESRLMPVLGDLSKPRLGLSLPQFNQLAETIEVIYHNGAQVNAVYPYSKLKAANVLGTQEVLYLASLVQTKPVHFVSSLAVFLSPDYAQRVVTETEVPNSTHLKGGYKQSKWVAEQIILTAQQRGLPACIYRTARIMGHTHTGITGNFKDLLYSLLKGCLQIQKYPVLDSLMNLVTIDYVSQAIVYLSRQPTSVGKVFHLFNPQPTSWQQLFEQLLALGYPLAPMDYDKWVAALKQYSSQQPNDKFSSALLLQLRASSLLSEKPRFDASQTMAGLIGSAIVCPPIDGALLTTYFLYLQKVGFIPAPEISV